jgi:putative membrane protein
MKLNHTLFIFYAAIWILLAIDPTYRDDWWLENIMVFIAIPIIFWSDKRVHFSHMSLWMLFGFFVLHSIGSHYTYSEMPWFSPITQLFGFERNHYDRLIHFLFGFLMFLPFYELFINLFKSKNFAFVFTVVFLLAASGVYEVIEWLATEVTHAQLGTAFLGTQGDQWDAQKDIALGHLGTILAMLLYYRQFITSKLQ